MNEKPSFKGNSNTDNKCNGYRTIQGLGFGKVLELRVPRDRFGVFKPMILEILKNQEEEQRDLCFELYGAGLSTRQIGDIVQKIYGKSRSANYVSDINQTFLWRNRVLERHYLAVYIDCIQVKVRCEFVDCEAFYIILGVNKDYEREVLAVTSVPTESAYGWQEELSKLKERGVERIDLFIADGLVGLENSIKSVFPNSDLQKCVTHFKRNVLNHVKSAHKQEIVEDLKEVFKIEKQEDSINMAIQRLNTF